MDILEFKNTLKRLCHSCDTCDKCPLHNDYNCWNLGNVTKELVEKVENWAKENPIKTNRDKFKEVFGFEIRITKEDCDGHACPSPYIYNCANCPNYKFWEKEYIEPSSKDCKQ